MPLVKTLSVGKGDLSYIVHGSDNFTIIDCLISADQCDDLLDKLEHAAEGKTIKRFISTHPDDDHFGGIELLDARMPIINFYVVDNAALKKNSSPSFEKYCELRDGPHAYKIFRGCSRRWMNLNGGGRMNSGLQIIWPNTSNQHFVKALADAESGAAYNDMSAAVRYKINDGPTFLWLGDMSTSFMENIEADIDLQPTDIVFAAHHGRDSGKIPDTWLEKLNPKIIIIGEAASRDLNYYTGYSSLTQNWAGDITMDCIYNKVHIYVSSNTYEKRDWLDDEGQVAYPNYIGTLSV